MEENEEPQIEEPHIKETEIEEGNGEEFDFAEEAYVGQEENDEDRHPKHPQQ